MSDNFHVEYDSSSADPYQTLRLLGHGGEGIVDEAVRISDMFQTPVARKRFFLSYYQRREKIEKIQAEVRIIRRLRHRHIVEITGTYLWKSEFGILIKPVAQGDLGEFLDLIDNMQEGRERDNLRRTLLQWPLCLIRAIDYMHEMRVKHRDIKPPNILIQGDNILLTDFGIAKDMSTENTTGTYGTVGPFTKNYSAPEVFHDGARRGRATDVFSLGCVLLEMDTVLMAPAGSLERFGNFRVEKAGTRAYAMNPLAILQWTWHLWTMSYPPGWFRNGVLSLLAFLMMDPDPSKRITARQLLALVSSSKLYYFKLMNPYACTHCKLPHAVDDENIPLHSVFRDDDDAWLEYLWNSKEALLSPPAQDWEDAKRKWLKHHMWWD